MNSLVDSSLKNQRLWKAAEDLAASKNTLMDKILDELGCPKTAVKWDPNIHSISNPILKTSLEWFQRKTQTIPIPKETVESLRDLNQIQGNLKFIDIVESGEDFKYRMNNSLHKKEDSTRLFLSAMWTPLQAFYMISYRAVLLKKMPLYSIHMPIPMLNIPEQERIVFPFIHNDVVERIMVASTPIHEETMH